MHQPDHFRPVSECHNRRSPPTALSPAPCQKSARSGAPIPSWFKLHKRTRPCFYVDLYSIVCKTCVTASARAEIIGECFRVSYPAAKWNYYSIFFG
jgi:hypothetical protein